MTDCTVGAACCDLHGQQCEPPGELCCAYCTEAGHPAHTGGTPCVVPAVVAWAAWWVPYEVPYEYGRAEWRWLELGMLWALLRAGHRVAVTIHALNLDAVTRMAERLGLRVTATEAGNGWVSVVTAAQV